MATEEAEVPPTNEYPTIVEEDTGQDDAPIAESSDNRDDLSSRDHAALGDNIAVEEGTQETEVSTKVDEGPVEELSSKEHIPEEEISTAIEDEAADSSEAGGIGGDIPDTQSEQLEVKEGDEVNDDTANGDAVNEGVNATVVGEDDNKEESEHSDLNKLETANDVASESPVDQTTDGESKTEDVVEASPSPLPESSTFGDGERPETPVVAVTEPLSREGSPIQEPEQIQPATPERRSSPVIEEVEDEFYDEDDELISREELIEYYHTTVTEREQLQNQNTQLQHKLAEYFRKKKTDDQRQEMDKNVTDQEQRYLKYMSNLEELRKQEEEERESLQEQLQDLKIKKDDKLHLVENETHQFAEFKKHTALNAINSRSGKPILPKDVEQYLMSEVKKEEEVKQVRLDNIKLKNRLKKREQQLKAKEELAEGLHLIDFEQLKIENQTYNEKIEERNEELLKLRKKITSTVQVLTHVKEKLQFVQAENQIQKVKLKEVEEYVAKKRDILSRTKKARDSLRIDNQRLRQKCGLLGNKPLLRDFEERKDEGDELRARLEHLKRQHAELTLDSNGLRRKIDEARAVRN